MKINLIAIFKAFQATAAMGDKKHTSFNIFKSPCIRFSVQINFCRLLPRVSELHLIQCQNRTTGLGRMYILVSIPQRIFQLFLSNKLQSSDFW